MKEARPTNISSLHHRRAALRQRAHAAGRARQEACVRSCGLGPWQGWHAQQDEDVLKLLADADSLHQPARSSL